MKGYLTKVARIAEDERLIGLLKLCSNESIAKEIAIEEEYCRMHETDSPWTWFQELEFVRDHAMTWWVNEFGEWGSFELCLERACERTKKELALD